MNHEVRVRTSCGPRRFVIGDDLLSSMSDLDQANSGVVLLLIASYLSLLADSPLGPDKPPAIYTKFITRLCKDGVKAVVIRFTGLAHDLVSNIIVCDGKTSIGPWIDGFRDTPVFKEYHEFYRTGNVAILRWIYTFLSFGKKMEYVDPQFDETAFRGWSHNEDRLRDLVLPEDVTSSLRTILEHVLPPFSIDDFYPKFGPGAVAEKGVRGRHSKIRNLAYDSLLDRVFFKSQYSTFGPIEGRGLTPQESIHSPVGWSPANGESSRISKLMFVPKNVKTARSICMEPNTLMYFQQGVLDQITRLIKISKFGKFIRLRDQSFNRRLSQIGSLTNLIDTLDLSSASDCLSYELVKRIFPTSWQIPMRATRSHSVTLPDESVHRLLKFAPMGSALCFPTQCIVFCAVGILAACLDTYLYADSVEPFLCWLTPTRIDGVVASFWQHTSTTRVGYQPLGIYGDDICVDSRLTHVVKSILTSLGFLVNVEKSFTGCQAFRESCGGFYIRGYDITPLYFSVKSVQEITNPEHVASQVHMINDCWVRRYKFTYRFLRQSILTWGSKRRSSTWNPILHVSDSRSFGILCKSPKNTHLRKRYNKDYQRDEIKCWTISYTEKYPAGGLLGAVDAYEYMRWWAGRRSEVTIEDRSSVQTYDTGCPGLLWRWMPEQ